MTTKPDAYCITLDREPHKFEKIKQEFDNILTLHRVSAIDGKETKIGGRAALYKTNVNLFHMLMDSPSPYVIIIEDDIYRYNDFDAQWPKIVEFISTETDWDFISLDFFLNLDYTRIFPYNDLFYRIEKSRSCGFVIYRTEFIRKNIEYLSKCGCLDMTMKHNTTFIQLISKKLIVKQIVDKRSNTGDVATGNYFYFYRDTEAYLIKHAPIEMK
jgi:GR25 family glycosyltransferase involved in LPS biosynthesis